jgi:hypothetical protein
MELFMHVSSWRMTLSDGWDMEGEVELDIAYKDYKRQPLQIHGCPSAPAP